MARVTVEDCIQVVNNRYELVLLAAQRARDIAAGAALTVDRDNDKNPVVALREIAGQTINLDELRRHISRGVNRHGDLNVEDETLATIAEQGPLLGPLPSMEIEEVSFEGEEAPAAEADAADTTDADAETDLELPSADEMAAELAADAEPAPMDEEDQVVA